LTGAADTVVVYWGLDLSTTTPGFFVNPEATGTPLLLVSLSEELEDDGSGTPSHRPRGLSADANQSIKISIDAFYILFY